MPYEGEFAQHRSIRRIATSDRVRDLLGEFRVSRLDTLQSDETAWIRKESLGLEDSPIEWILAVDGSHLEVRVENGYPQAEASYVTVASVLLNLEAMRALDGDRPADPVAFRKVEQAHSLDCALPSCNVVRQGHDSAKESLRQALFDVVCGYVSIEGAETLQDTYEVLLAYKPHHQQQRCPLDGCDRELPNVGAGVGSCACELQQPIYSTDALRIHEGMSLEGTNGAMFAEIMQILERVSVVHFLRVFEQQGWLSILDRLAIVLDGPLAVFGHPAWLSHAIETELERINAKIYEKCGHDLLMIGVEKSGAFVQHFEDLDRRRDGGWGRIENGAALLLDDQYIKSHIVFSDSSKPFGQDTYFGRKLFYKTTSGARVVASLPVLDDHHRDTTTALPSQYPELSSALSVLDQLVSSRYQNAVTPLVAAHAEAAIPLNLGSRVLEQVARDLVRKG